VPLDEVTSREIVRIFGQHLVGLSVIYKLADEEGLPCRFSMSSGTLIIIGDAVYFLTAGHVLERLDALRLSMTVEIKGAALADTFGWKRVSNIPIPFDLRNAEFFYIDNDKAGLDIGLIRLHPHHVRLLAKNGLIAISEENWAHQHEVQFDAYAMLGFPQERASVRLDEFGCASVEPILLNVYPLQSAPEDRAPTDHPQFVGRIGDNLPFSTIEGMSGGPIFGFRLKPTPQHWIVALQSSWNPSTRTVYGSHLPTFASLLTKWAREHADNHAPG
jgi:hypothetical protein